MITVIYPVPEIFPDNRARFIQIINTCSALASIELNVKLITGIKKGYRKEDIFQFYELPYQKNLEIIKLPLIRRENKKFLRISWNAVFFWSLLCYLLFKKPTTASILFLRHLKLANFLLKFRKILKIPIIFEVHEIFHLNMLNERKKEKIKNTEIKVYRNVNALICISDRLKHYLIKNFNIEKEKIFVIPDGVKKEWLEIKTVHPSYICYIGSLYKWKGIDILLSAMKYLPKERLLVVGGGKRLNELKEFVEKENLTERIIFVGDIPHVKIPEYFSKAKVAVIPNIALGPSEFSSPLKLFEYMAAGVPIVASDLPVFREILENEKTAIFFEPGNPKALAEAIKKIVYSEDLAKTLSANAKKLAQNFTYEKRGEKIYKLLLKIIEEHRHD